MSELATRSEAQAPARQLAVWERWNLPRDKWETIRRMCCDNAPDDVMELYLEKCRALGCDPFERMFYVVPRNDTRTNTVKWTMQSSIDLLRSIANSEPGDEYAGQLGPFWTSDGEKWTDVWLAKSHPVACKIGILRKSFKEPLWVVGTMDYYKPSTNSNFWSVGKSWFQLAKCVEALALRKAFPKRLHGLYTGDEMEQDRNATRRAMPAEALTGDPVLPPPANPAQALLAQRAAEQRAKVEDTPEGRATAVSMIRTFAERQGLEMPNLLGTESIEGLRSVMESLRAEAIAMREHRAAGAADGAPADALDAVSRPLPPDSDGVKASEASLKKLFVELKETLGITQKNERLSWAHKFGGQLADLGSYGELSQGQVSYLIDRLKETPSPTSAATCESCGSFAGAGHAPDCEIAR